MTTGLVDIAGNLTNKAFREDLSAVLARAEAADLHAIVVAGVSTTTSRRGWEMAADHRGSVRLVATSGIHPHHASQGGPQALAEIAEIAAKLGCIAVGECGLDYNRDFCPRDVQRKTFEAQLEIAAGLKKPVYLHERDAHEDFLAIMTRWRPQLIGGVVHCFTGTGEAMRAYLDLDLHVGFTGWLCDERRGTHLRALVKDVPAGRFMVETDAPYILPRDLPARPKSGRNEPAYVRHIAQVIARLRDETEAELAAHTTATARQLFALDDHCSALLSSSRTTP